MCSFVSKEKIIGQPFLVNEKNKIMCTKISFFEMCSLYTSKCSGAIGLSTTSI